MPEFWFSQDLNDEEKLFRNVVRAFVENTINTLLNEAKKDYIGVTRKMFREAGKHGILGLSIPTEFGGQGASAAVQGIAYEEMGRAKIIGYGVPRPLNATHVNFARGCATSLVTKWMPKFLGGEAILGIASTEPRSGSDVANIATTALKRGDKYILNGEKGPVSGITDTNAWIILARTGSTDSGAKGISEFFIESDAPGISKSHFDSMEESADLGTLKLDNVEVSADHLVGAENKGFYGQMKAFDLERALNPMRYVGAAMDSIEMSVRYTNDRVVWEKPIAAFEGIMFPLVEAITKVESIRAFSYAVLRAYDRGERITKEASMLRWYTTKIILEALDTCIQVNGAQGYTDNVPHQRRYRWVRAGLFGHGTQEVQKLIIGRQIWGKEIYNIALGRKSWYI